MRPEYDVIHFEALGAEAEHLKRETEQAVQAGLLPEGFRALITPDTLQEYLEANPDCCLPEIVTIKTHSEIPAGWLEGKKKSIITRSTGYDHVEAYEKLANVTSLREYCVSAVAQTAIKFLYATAGHLKEFEANTATFERKNVHSFMEMAPGRMVTVFGAGKIGKKICDLVRANNMDVQAVDVREKELDRLYGGSLRFVSKEEAIRTSDVIINAMNLTKNPGSVFYNEGYFSYDYLRRANPGLLFINVTRGEIAPESVLLPLYKEGLIAGIGLDVFSAEDRFTKALQDGRIVSDPDLVAGMILLEMAGSGKNNIYVQPHQGFNSDLAARTKAEEAVLKIENWYQNNKERFDEQLPYYGKVS